MRYVSEGNNMTKILSIDPGHVSGYILATVDLNNFSVKKIMRKGEFHFEDYSAIMRMLSVAKTVDVLVIEDFIVRQPLIGDPLYTVRLIGVFEYLFKKKTVLQAPIEKTEFPDKRLRQLKTWHKSLHVRDAIRHLHIYLANQRRKQIAQEVGKKSKAKKLRSKRRSHNK